MSSSAETQTTVPGARSSLPRVEIAYGVRVPEPQWGIGSYYDDDPMPVLSAETPQTTTSAEYALGWVSLYMAGDLEPQV